MGRIFLSGVKNSNIYSRPFPKKAITYQLTESVDEQKNVFGLPRVLEIMRSLRKEPAEEVVKGFLSAVRNYTNNKQPFDDLTIFTLKVIE